MANIQIRKVGADDLDGCYNVENQCYGEEGATKEGIEKRIEIFPEGFFVATDNDEIIGIINGTSTDKDDMSNEELKGMHDFSREGKNIIIFSVAVRPDYRKKGIARMMLEKFIEHCKKMNKEKVLLLCRKELIPMYEKFGFKYICESKSRHGGIRWQEMELALS